MWCALFGINYLISLCLSSIYCRQVTKSLTFTPISKKSVLLLSGYRWKKLRFGEVKLARPKVTARLCPLACCCHGDMLWLRDSCCSLPTRQQQDDCPGIQSIASEVSLPWFQPWFHNLGKSDKPLLACFFFPKNGHSNLLKSLGWCKWQVRFLLVFHDVLWGCS